MFIELHMIQNFAPANLNRDDTNNPKDCEFGGARRARISSQCIKRAIRTAPIFVAATGMETGLRTKRVIKQLRDILLPADQSSPRLKPEAEVNTVLPAFVTAFLSKLDKDPEKTAVLLYLSPAEVKGMAQLLLDNWDELADEKRRAAGVERLAKALTKEYKDRTSAADIALFGRMLAEKPELSLDAACQVAHAISTHRVAMEMDFYTAVDDLNPDDTAGAGMMGFTGYNSACFYRYARLDWEQLVKNLAGDVDLARRTVKGFLLASLDAVPTGKQNAFAAQNPPSLALAVVRDGGPGWSLANAFERPVRANGDSGYVAPSVAALDAYWKSLTDVYGSNSVQAVAVLAVPADLPLQTLKEYQVTNRDAWVQEVLAKLPGEA